MASTAHEAGAVEAPPFELVITPKKSLAINWHELWDYRELFYFFAWRDIKARYKQTLIGASWAIVQPFVLMIVFTLFFNKVAGIKSHGAPYAIFSYTGLLFWNCFSQSLSRCSDSLVTNQSIVTKTYFPRVIVPVSAVVVPIVDFFFALIVFVALMAYYGIVPGWRGVALFVPMLVVTALAAAGLGMFLAAVNVKYRDIRQALPFFLQSLLFVTPVIYPVSLVPQRFQWALYLNPMTGVITTMRSTLIHQGNAPPGLVAISVASTVALLFVGFSYFRRSEHEFADII